MIQYHRDAGSNDALLDDLKGLVGETTQKARTELASAFSERVHPVFPLLDSQWLETEAHSTSLEVSIYLLAYHYCSEARDIDANLLADLYVKMRHLATGKPRLESVEAAVLYSQRQTDLMRYVAIP